MIDISAKLNEDGFVVLEDVYSSSDIDEMKWEMDKIVDSMDLEGQPKSVFSTYSDEQHISDEFFLNSADKIRPFFEEGALNKEGKLVVTHQRALNKVGHANVSLFIPRLPSIIIDPVISWHNNLFFSRVFHPSQKINKGPLELMAQCHMFSLLVVILLGSRLSSVSANCNARLYSGSDVNLVCVCNSTYCDEIPRIGPLRSDEAVVIQTSLAGQRFERDTAKFGQPLPGGPSISVDPRVTYQEIYGFGGAFTDSAGINIASLSPGAQKKLLNSYFSENGVEYTIGRVPMASCDFSTREYSYLDNPEDYALTGFKLAEEDYKYKIPYIKAALNLTQGNIALFASPWSAPGWMKETGRMKGTGALRNDSKVHKAYADYFVRFFEEYHKEKIGFWGATIQNEPTTGAIPGWKWQTMFYTAATQRDFVRDHLGPALANSKVTNTLQLMGLDDGRIMLPGWADTIFNDDIAKNYVAGIGVHWYGDFYSPTFLLDLTHNRHPDKFILATEACAGFTFPQGPVLGDWYRAEEYADSIITNLNHWVTGWTDWNLALDLDGGPNWVGNIVDSPIIVNRTADEFYKQPMFYAMGHFSKFLRPGSRRIAHKVSSDVDHLYVVAANKNARRSLVILNRSSNLIENLSIFEKSSPGRALAVTIPPHSITTVVWQKAGRKKNYSYGA